MTVERIATSRGNYGASDNNPVDVLEMIELSRPLIHPFAQALDSNFQA